MKKYSLDELVHELATDRNARNGFYSWWLLKGGHYDKAILTRYAPSVSCKYAELARAEFETNMTDPSTSESLLREYLPVYSALRNEQEWTQGKEQAKQFGLAGIGLVVFFQLAGVEPARILTVGFGLYEAGVGIALLRHYLKHRA